ncbi:MAG: sigma-70 family RNA polymerase sigma factor [Planctomycetes bacterium]|nr:sigma-70 family RNA polymerase sigma factor [Planctomycetota bacterium]
MKRREEERRPVEPQQDPRSDDELLRRFASGDASALEEVYRRHRGAVFLFLQGLLPSPAVAEDLTQDLFCALIERPEPATGVRSLRAWLLVAARNRALNWRKRARLESDRLGEVAERALFLAAGAAGGPGGAEEGRGAGEDPAALAERRELCARASGEVLARPEREREAVLLRIWGGLTFREVGEVCGIPLDTAVSRYHAGLCRLRATLDPAPKPTA